MNAIRSSSANDLYIFEDGKRVFPCRCGEIHRGEYAEYEYAHHNCLHDDGLVWIVGPADTPKQNDWSLMCAGCGKTFDVLDDEAKP